MICKYCKGGRAATHTRPVVEWADFAPPASIRSVAVAVERACPGGSWCDCQHRVALGWTPVFNSVGVVLAGG